MSSVPAPDLSKSQTGNSHAILLLIVATLLALVPFIDKPFHIDDPLFIWGAKHIRETFWTRPFDFYGFDVLWSARYEPMHQTTQNPPLALYFLAAASLPGGWDEVWLHAACLIPAIGVVVGTWRLGLGMTRRPLLAGLAVLCTPIFLISSTNVMCDTLMVCLWVWSIILWREGLAHGSQWRLFAAVLLVGMAALTKYFAVSLIPLLALFTIARERRPVLPLLWLLIPCAMLIGYQFWTKHLYGHGLLTSAADYARKNYQLLGAPAKVKLVRTPVSIFAVTEVLEAAKPVLMKSFSTLTFTGGSLLCLLFFAPRISRTRVILLAAVLVGILIWALLHYQPHFLKPRGTRPTSWDLAIQGALLVVTGLGVIWLLLTDLWYSCGAPFSKRTAVGGASPIATEPVGALPVSDRRKQLADSLLLGAWVGGTLLFAGAINWTVNGRSLLPLVPPAAILMCRGLDRGVGAVMSPFWEGWLLIPAAAITMIVTHADYRLATTAKEASETLMAVARNNQVTLWFTGHWGFQYYMEQQGAKPVHNQVGMLEKFDLFALPEHNDVQILPPPESGVIDRYKFLISKWASTHQGDRCTGFYSDAWGGMPFVLGPEWHAFDPELPPVTADSRFIPTNDDAIVREQPYDIYRLGRMTESVNLKERLRRLRQSSTD